MGHLDMSKDLRLSVCREFIEKEFGGAINLSRNENDVYLTASHVGPSGAEGDSVIAYDALADEWFEMEDWETFVNIVYDGKIFICYPMQDEEGISMYLKVEHPREAAEVLHLITHPKSCTAPVDSGESPMKTYHLGDLFSLHVLTPRERSWCLIDPQSLPAGAPEKLQSMILSNVIRDWDSFMNGDTVRAVELTEQHPAYCGLLPDAAEALRAGYILDDEAKISCATDFVTKEPNGNDLFLDLLMVPRLTGVSYLYIRELLSRDAGLQKNLKAVFDKPSSLAELAGRFNRIEIEMPSRYFHQIREAVEHMLVRENLSYLAEAIATTPGEFRKMKERNRAMAKALHQVLHRPDFTLAAVPVPGVPENMTNGGVS